VKKIMLGVAALMLPVVAQASGFGGVWALTEVVSHNTCEDSYAIGTTWGIVMSLNVDPSGKVDAKPTGNTSWEAYSGTIASSRVVLDGERLGNRSNYNIEMLADGSLKGTRTISFTSACTLIAEVTGNRISP